MITINAKPMSVNDCWQGRRFKTQEYKRYEQFCKLFLKKQSWLDFTRPLLVWFEFWFSNKASDCDNPIKPHLDILSKIYWFNDNMIYKIVANKKIVPKGQEYTKIFISNL